MNEMLVDQQKKQGKSILEMMKDCKPLSTPSASNLGLDIEAMLRELEN